MGQGEKRGNLIACIVEKVKRYRREKEAKEEEIMKRGKERVLGRLEKMIEEKKRELGIEDELDKDNKSDT